MYDEYLTVTLEGYTYNRFLTENNIPAFVGCWRKRKALCNIVLCSSNSGGRGPQGWCELCLMSKKMINMMSLAKRGTFSQHARCSQLPTFPLLLEHQTHMHPSTVAPTFWFVLGRYVAVQPIHQTVADQSSPTSRCRLSALVCAQNLAVLHLAVTQLQSHLAF